MGFRIYRADGCVRDLVGRVDYGAAIDSSFAYDQAYLDRAERNGEFGISEQLPLNTDAFSIKEFGPFFQGLLPEGPVLGELARRYQVPESDYLSMIEQLGCEGIGALTFVADGVDESEYEPRYDSVGAEGFYAIADSPTRAAAAVASETRLSLSGAQSKIAWALPEGLDPRNAAEEDWLVPRGTAASTHIIKIPRKGEEDLATNEMACALLAGECGIDAARVCRVKGLEGAIAVERYDRAWMTCDGQRIVTRLHQEDFCQALGLATNFKYQPEGTDVDYLGWVSGLIGETSVNPFADTLEFARRMVFSYAVGNTDFHLKNSSLLYAPNWKTRRLSPMYDITCIPLTGYSLKMPFMIGEHRELEELDERDILSIAISLDIPLAAFDQAMSQVLQAFRGARPDNDEVASMANRIIENAEPRLQVIERALAL